MGIAYIAFTFVRMTVHMRFMGIRSVVMRQLMLAVIVSFLGAVVVVMIVSVVVFMLMVMSVVVFMLMVMLMRMVVLMLMLVVVRHLALSFRSC